MKFEVLQEQLAKGLGLVSKAVASRPQLPVLANILIEAKSDGLVLSATDLELGIVTRIPAKVETVGVVSVPARMFLDFVGSLKPGKVECELVKEALVVKASGYRGRIQTISAEEFPALPDVSSELMGNVIGGKFSSGVVSVLHSAAKDALRPVLTGVLLDYAGSGKLKMVATDGFRLAIKSIEIDGEGWEKPVLVPARAVAEAAKLSGEGDLGIVIYPETSQVVFQVENSIVVSQLLSGNYPEYQRIVPKEFSGVVEVSRDDLLSALKTVHIFARENSNVVKWVVSESGIELLAETPEKGEAKAEVAGGLQGDGGEIVFNAKFVLDFLQASKVGNVTLSITDSLSPGGLREVGEKDYLYVIMPINA